MGIEYYLADKRRKRLFELGKGAWAAMQISATDRRPCTFDGWAREPVCVFLFGVTASWNFDGTAEQQVYVGQLYERLLRFVYGLTQDELEVMNEERAGDVIEDEGYVLVDSRYSSEWPKYDDMRDKA